MKSFIFLIPDHKGNNNTVFAIAGSEDSDGGTSATTFLVTPGFMGTDHPHECLSFWYTIKVRDSDPGL